MKKCDTLFYHTTFCGANIKISMIIDYWVTPPIL